MLAGVPQLTRLALRRDRWLLTGWLVALLGICYASAAGTTALYRTTAEQVAAARAIDANPAVVALYGPILDVHSRGELAMTKMTVLYALFVGLLLVVLVRRHTRTEEESGLAELVGGTAVNSDAPWIAAALESVIVSVVLGLLAALADIAGGLPAAGSLAFGLTWTGVGLVAAAVTAVACQASASTRTCGGIAVGALGVLFVVRAAGDPSGSWVGWLSPFGWSTRARAWSETRWWVYLLYVALAAVLVVIAALLRRRRDLGSGLLAAHPGPPSGSRRLGGPIGLAWRVHRGAILGWTIAMAGMGLLTGLLVPGLGDLLSSGSARQMIERLGGVHGLQDGLLAAVLSIGAVAATCFALTLTVRAASDEQAGRAEEVLATGTTRTGLFAGTTLLAAGGAAWLMLALAAGETVGYGHGAGRLLGAALGHVPAVWVVIGIGLLAWAARSRWAVLGWVVVALFVTLGQVGALLSLPEWVRHASPYEQVHLPGGEVSAGSLAAMTALALVLAVLSALRYRTRDIG